MFGLQDKDIVAIREVLEQHLEVEGAILYGSRAKGNYTAASDIDLTLVGDQLTLTLQLAIDGELDDLLLPYTIDLSVLHKISNPELVAHIKRAGVSFYERKQ